MEPSASKIAVKITVHGKGEASADLLRHLAPMTVNALMMKMPLHGRVNRLSEGVVCIISGVIAGAEKSRTRFAREEIAFLPLNGSICVFLKDGQAARPMNPVGHVTSGLEMLDTIGSGDTVTIETT